MLVCPILFLSEKLSKHRFIKTRSTKKRHREEHDLTTKIENLFKLLLFYFLFVQLFNRMYIQIAFYGHMIVVYCCTLFLIFIVKF